MSDVREWKHERRIDTRHPWLPGPWDNEPDKIQWVDDATKLDCLMHRNRVGAWCGYVGVAEGHFAFEKPYDEVSVDVHGGLTYSDFCQETEDESKGICHIPLPGRPHRVWWLGFDCNHAGDIAPGLQAYEQHDPELKAIKTMYADIHDHDEYRDRAYVEKEVTQLAAQLALL